MSVKRIKLLLIEDDIGDRRLLQVFLRQLSATLEFEVFTAETLTEGLDVLQSESLDLVLLDLNLPDSHGLGTVDAVCAANALLPVVVLTGLADEQVGIEAIKRGASDYVVKGDGVKDILYRAICYSLERKQTEKELRESAEKYKTLYESSRDAIMMLAPPSWKFTAGNSATLEMFCAANEAEFTCMGPWDVAPEVQPDGRRSSDKAREMINRAMKEGSHFFEWQHIRLDGREFPTTVLLTRINVNDTVLLQATVRDITEQKQSEQDNEQLQAQLRQAQKMEAIGTLAGGIAHDFNNILMSMLGYTDLTLQDLPEVSQGRRHLEQVLIAGKRAKDLVKQILCFSRQEEQVQEPIEIASVVSEALTLLRSSIPETIDIHLDIEAADSSIMANPTQIHQVIINLCTNAIHAMEDRGGVLEVTLTEFETESIRVTCHRTLQPGAYVQLTVHDTGRGMGGEVMTRIFEPFYTTKAINKGTGMGLSTVYGIVESHGGAIALDSQPGKGTTFRVFFPRIDHADTSEATSSGVKTDPRETILVVDDDRTFIVIMTRVLERLGYAVVGQHNGIYALDAFRSDPDRFDLVITDHAMPLMSGMQLAKELINIRSDIPVILCSAFADDIAFEQGTYVGIKEFVTKPVVAESMAVLIRRLLDKKEVKV